ncbi:MAG: radical SAM family heme chaperone HemW [Ruminococcaceae bacterium]|nr:radical SAM family heme chaperone HemW [Oscillospiraceae bacterium]
MAIFGRKEKTPLGIYIHVPFCRSKCQYCDFYSLTDKSDRLMEDYLDAVCDHIRETGRSSVGYQVDTIYFGGGTPSFFGADGMAAILTAVRRSFPVAASAEITFEANPDSVSPKLLRRLRGEGFNRVSLGIQCDDDRILEKIGRPHKYEQAVQAVEKIRKAGFKNLSVDLIYGLPGQTLESWQKTLQHVLQLEPEHISCYGLKVEEGTPLYKYRDVSNLPDDDTQADMYLSTVEILRNKGYRQYEISNFCRRGYESRHNMKYWTGGEYLGFGPDASSDFAGKRFKIIRDLKGYIQGIQNKGMVLEDIQEIPYRERAGEYLMMRLRTTQGISREEYEKNFLLPFTPLESYLEECRQQGHALGADGRWRLTPEGFLLSNTILTKLLLLQDESEPLAKRRT